MTDYLDATEATEYLTFGLTVTHLDGVPWHQAPTPRRLHRCSARTTGWLNLLDRVDRCACGAIRVQPAFARKSSRWRERNSR